jgi:hypothetical protein
VTDSMIFLVCIFGTRRAVKLFRPPGEFDVGCLRKIGGREKYYIRQLIFESTLRRRPL